jgi:hypothetical protein
VTQWIPGETTPSVGIACVGREASIDGSSVIDASSVERKAAIRGSGVGERPAIVEPTIEGTSVALVED